MNIDWTIAPALVQKCFQTNWRICKILQKKDNHRIPKHTGKSAPIKIYKGVK